MKTQNFPEKQNLRRKKVMNRLVSQLAQGIKNTSEGEVALTESDRTRIEREINTLKSRVQTSLRDKRSKRHY